MKITRIIELINCIKRTKVTLVSITIFIMMSIAVYLGFMWTVDTIVRSTEKYFEDTSFRDAEIKLSYGIDDDLIANISDIPDVSVVEPIYISYRDFNLYDKRYISEIISITKDIDVIDVVEGKLPEKENELAIIDSFAKKNNIEVGTHISFIDNEKSVAIKHIFNKDLQKLIEDEYVSELKKDDFIITATINSSTYLSKEEEIWGFNDKSLPINCIFYAPISVFNLDAYNGYSRLLVKFKNLARLRMNTKNYESKLQDNIDKIDIVSKKYNASRYRKLMANAKILEDEIKGNIESVENTVIEINDKLIMNDIDSYTVEEKQDIRNTMEEAVLESSFNRKNLKAFTDFINELKEYDIHCLDRKHNLSYFTLLHVYESFDNIKYSFSLLFIVVGILISYCAFSRLIYEDASRIGLKKALGFYEDEVAIFYYLYDFSCCILGIIGGGLIARFAVEPILISSVKKYFSLNNIEFAFSFLELFLFGILIVSIQTLTVFIACKNILRKNANDLIINKLDVKTTKRFYERFFVYKKLPWFTKAIINNFFTDKRRVFSTLVNISGCVSLIICAFSLKNFINNSFNIHFNKIYNFDTVIHIDENSTSVQAKLDKLGIDYAQMDSVYWYIDTLDHKHLSICANIFPDNKYDKYISLYDDKKKLSLDDGLWLSCAYKYKYNSKIGDILKITDEKGNKYNIPIAGFFDYYLTPNQIFIKKKYYEDVFGGEYKTNALFLDTNYIDKEILCKELEHIDGFKFFQDYYSMSRTIFDATGNTINILVYTYVVLAFLISILSLLNLFKMYIEEKRKEIITLIINGYTRRDTKKYIYQDTIFLTFISLIIGAFVGVVMANISILGFQHENLHYISGVDMNALIIGFIISIVFVMITSIVSLRIIDKLQLSDINKL